MSNGTRLDNSVYYLLVDNKKKPQGFKIINTKIIK